MSDRAVIGAQDPMQPVRAVAHHHLRHSTASAQRRLMDMRAAEVGLRNGMQHLQATDFNSHTLITSTYPEELLPVDCFLWGAASSAQRYCYHSQRMRRPPFSSCRTPSSKRELAGSRGYATINSSGQAPEDSAAGGPLDVSGCAAPSAHEDPAEEHEILPGLAAEHAGLGKAPSDTPKACASTDSEVGGASSGGSCAGLAAVGQLACCPSEAQGGSSCSAGCAGLSSDDTVGRESGALENGQEGTAVAPAVQKGADCTSEAALQHSEQETNNSVMHVCQAPVHQAHTAEASDHQQLEATAQPTQQSVILAGSEAEPNSEDVECTALAEAWSASPEAPELTATAASGSAGGSLGGCESAATCAAAPTWAWATAAPAAASADPQLGHSGLHDGTPHAPQADLQTARQFLQAALQLLPPSHALPSRGLEPMDDDEDCQVKLAPRSLASFPRLHRLQQNARISWEPNDTMCAADDMSLSDAHDNF